MTARILIIAGSDSGGGAGIQADLKTVTLLGGHGMTAITALTAQNTVGVTHVHPVPPQMVVAQIDAVASDLGVDAVKVGMLGSAQTAQAVADRLPALGCPVVFDPVMVATSGAALADPSTIAVFHRLMKLATVTTPNLPELKALGGESALTGPALLKGGHAAGDVVVDRLVSGEEELARWEGPRIETRHTHGTGCTLASAIACGLGQGLSLIDSIERARLFVRLALRGAPQLGQGHGPMGHGTVREDAMTPGFSLNQLTLDASNLAASVDFYRRLGLRLLVQNADGSYARFEAPNGVTLSLHLTTSPPNTATVYFESRHLEQWVAQLQAAGFRFEQLPRDEPWLWKEARLKDPHGNGVCLYRAGEARRFPPWRLP